MSHKLALVLALLATQTAAAQDCPSDTSPGRAWYSGIADLFRFGGERAPAPATTWTEVYEGGSKEAEFVLNTERANEMERVMRAVAGSGDGNLRRGFHAKLHWAGQVKFEVLDGIPEFARHGIFAKPGEYDAYLRFSKGRGGEAANAADKERDVQGLALKVNTGERHELHNGEMSASQDFNLTNREVSHARNAGQFLAFVRASEAARVSGKRTDLLGALRKDIGFWETARMLGSLATSTRPIDSLAQGEYWGAAVKVGPYAAKYTLQPIEDGAEFPEPDEAPPDGASARRNAERERKDRPNYLREDLAARRAKAPVKYKMYLQFYENESKTPIEDATKEWDAPLVPVAIVTIPPVGDPAREKAEQDIAEALKYSPFNTPVGDAGLRPVGSIQRVRVFTYPKSSSLRAAELEPW